MEKNREFSSVCTFDYKKYKEFALGAVSTRNEYFVYVCFFAFINFIYDYGQLWTGNNNWNYMWDIFDYI